MYNVHADYAIMLACISPNVLAVLCGILMPSLSCPCGLEVMYCCSCGVKLVVCAIVHNRNAVVCPCLCTVEASHFCV